MSESESSPKVQQAEKFVREHLPRTEPSPLPSYERKGAHVTVGNEKPLASDFASSGSRRDTSKLR